MPRRNGRVGSSDAFPEGTIDVLIMVDEIRIEDFEFRYPGLLGERGMQPERFKLVIAPGREIKGRPTCLSAMLVSLYHRPPTSAAAAYTLWASPIQHNGGLE